MTTTTIPRSTRSPFRQSWLLIALEVVTLALVVLGSIGLLSLRGASGDQPRGPGVAPTETASPTPSATPSRRPRPTPSSTPTPIPATPAPVVTPAPPPTPGHGGLPVCTYADVLTPYQGYNEWAISLLDTIYMLPSGYHPTDLVDSSAAGLNGGYAVRSLVVNDLRAMADAARAAGAPIQVVSGFRSYHQQEETFNYWVSVGGYEQALRTSARAGHSEHQLGTTLDFTSEGGAAPWEYADWATTPAGSWMRANAWRYGFVMSYPAGGFDRTCYDYEPWHYRYVGRDLAAAVTNSGLTPREYLWELQP